VQLTARNAELRDLVGILRDQQARKIDVVTPARTLRFDNGVLHVSGAEPLVDENGVTTVDGPYRPTAAFDEGAAEKLKIPLPYLRRLRTERPDLYDANTNGWLHGAASPGGDPTPTGGPDPRSFLLRLFRGDDGGPGVARALLSNKYQRIENLDVLMAALDGVRRAGVHIDVAGADLSERRMYLRITAPEIQAVAPALLRDYRSPFTGVRGADNPVVFAGLEISNSELGGGAFTLTPRLVVRVCSNGMQITKDAMRSVHLGGRLGDGVIRWTEETQRKALELVVAKTTDAVATFLDATYMRQVLDDIQAVAGARVTDPVGTITTLSKKLAYDEATTAGILEHFVRGADTTAGGVLHAVTSYAQTLPDADDADKLEASAIRAMQLAAA
jgi:hypothetical protein